MQKGSSNVFRVRAKRRHHGEPSFRRNVPKRRFGSQGSTLGQRHEHRENRGEALLPLRSFASSGLTLPSLADLPTHYQIETGLRETACLTTALVKHDVLPATAFKQGQRLLEFLHEAFATRFRDLGLGTGQLSITLRLADEGRNQLGGFFFTLNLEPHYLDLAPVVQKLDAINQRVAPALIDALQCTCGKLVPVFEGQCCVETVSWLIWGGDEDELLWRAREDLAYERGVHRETVTTGEARSYAESHFLTGRHINERLEPRFQVTQAMPLKKLRSTFKKNGLDSFVKLCDHLTQLENLALPESDENVFVDNGDFYPYGLVLGLPQGNANDFVAEMFDELQQHVWNAGGWAPSYLCEIKLDSSESLDKFATSLKAVLEGLALITKIVKLLEEETHDTP